VYYWLKCEGDPFCRENNTGGNPRGLNQFFRALRYWLYGSDPFEPMQWQDPLDRIKHRLATDEDVFGAKFVCGRLPLP
jgi:hypothetical protein